MSDQLLQPRSRTSAPHDEMLRGTEEALQSGRSTLLKMEQQDEILSASEQNIESTEHIMQQSLRVVRGMTWSGMFYNMVKSGPALDAGRNEYTNRNDHGSVNSDHRGGIVSAPNSASSSSGSVSGGGGNMTTQSQGRDELFSGPTTTRSTAVSQKRRDQDNALDAVSRNLEEIHSISVTMGESLDAQHAKLDSITAKTDRTNDATIEVLLKSSQLIDRNSSIKPVFLGEFCFELHTGGYLSVQDEQLVIAPPHADISTTFRCYNKGDIFAMLSRRTMKYLATGYFTPITVSGMKFNSATHMFLDLSGEYNGLLMLSCNWGGGGWLKFGDGTFKLTTGLSDKDNRVLLRAVPLAPREHKADT